MFSKALLSFHWIKRWSQSFHGWGHDIQSARPACCPTRSPRNSLKQKSKQSSSPIWGLCDFCSFCHLVGQPTRNREQDHTSLLAVSDGERMAFYVGAFLPVICNLIVSVIVVTITILVFVPSLVQPLLAPSVITIIFFMIRICFPSTSTITRNLNLLDFLLHLMIKTCL